MESIYGAGLCSALFENTFLRFFRFQKKHDFLRFFEMTFQKNVKNRTKSIKFAECL